MSSVLPDSEQKTIRLLTLAVSRNNPEAVARQLGEGADPNGFCKERVFPLVRAVRTWSSRTRSEEEKRKAETIINMLLDAGASPLAFNGNSSPVIGSLLRVCAYPRCLELALEGARDWAQALKEREAIPARERDSAVSLLQMVKEDSPEHQSIRKHLLDLELQGSTWWHAAIVSRSPTLMKFALENQNRIDGGAPSLGWMNQFLREHTGGAIQEPHGVLLWLEHLSEKQQVEALLGPEGEEGILAATIDQMSMVQGPVWEFALNHPLVVDAMESQGKLKGFLAISVLGEAKNSQGLLRQAVRKNVDVGSITIEDARVVKSSIPAWDKPYLEENRPSPQASLLECHLKRNDGGTSISMLRALTKAGVRPDYMALAALCRRMNSSSQTRNLFRLAEEWIEAHKVDPAPEHAIPVWELIKDSRDVLQSTQERMRDRHLQRKMESSFPQACKAEARLPKTRF